MSDTSTLKLRKRLINVHVKVKIVRWYDFECIKYFFLSTLVIHIDVSKAMLEARAYKNILRTEIIVTTDFVLFFVTRIKRSVDFVDFCDGRR